MNVARTHTRTAALGSFGRRTSRYASSHIALDFSPRALKIGWTRRRPPFSIRRTPCRNKVVESAVRTVQVSIAREKLSRQLLALRAMSVK